MAPAKRSACEAVEGPKKSAHGAIEGMSVRKSKEWGVLRLHIVRGSLTHTDADGAAGGQHAMASALWSNLPEDLLWRVFRFVPAAKHFQWQSVSRKWRRVLTSGEFCNALVSRPLEEQRVVASVVLMTPLYCRGYGDGDNSTSSRHKVVDIDLSSMVPSSLSFWITDPNCVQLKAAGDGLVCIGNGEYGSPASHFVLNPLTRMCKVLPLLPFKPEVWLPLTSTTVTMLGYLTEAGGRAVEVDVATYDLAAGGCEWDLAAYKSGEVWAPEDSPFVRLAKGKVALCAGEFFWYRKNRVHVMVPRPGGRLVEITALDEPSEALGINLELMTGQLAVHENALFFVRGQELFQVADVVMVVWRLARERLEWELVAWLDVAELRRLTGLARIRRKSVMCLMWTACAVRGVLYFNMFVSNKLKRRCMLGLNLDTGEWMLVDYVQGPVVEWLLELGPDLPQSRVTV